MASWLHPTIGMLGLEDTRLRALVGEMRAIGTVALSLPLRWLPGATRLAAAAPGETPVVLVHGLCGDPTNFLALERRLAARGVRNVASFAYGPRLDYQRLAAELGELVDHVRAVTGAHQVDVVGHSLGGLVGRYLTEIDRRSVRRLVTLGAPSWGRIASHELAIFGAEDVIVPAPEPSAAARGRVRVIPACGHLGLLYHPEVLDEILQHLGGRAQVRELPLTARRRAA